MNMQKFTQKSLEAIQQAQSIAIEHKNMQIEQPHLFYAIITQSDSIGGELFKRMNIDINSLTSAVESAINSIPGVSGSGREPDKVYVSGDVDTALVFAEKLAENMGDEYVSVEHILMAIIDKPDYKMKEILKRFSINKNDFLKVLKDIRGNARVTTDRPESTYDVLKKIRSRPCGTCGKR
jgi:ATP-dependent Clp protease ATP-binding subunit ClpB